jgi:hypothetical protein
MGMGANSPQPASNQVYYDSSKGQYYTMAQPKSNSPYYNQYNQAAGGMGGKGKGEDGRTYIGNSQNNTTTNSLANYTAPQFQQQQNPYVNYYAQQQMRRNPWARTEFGMQPQQPAAQPAAQPEQPFMGGYDQGYPQQQLGGMPPWARQQYYQGPFQQYGMGGKGGAQQNPYAQQVNYGQQPTYGSMGGKGMGGKGGAAGPQYQGGMGGKGKGNS